MWKLAVNEADIDRGWQPIPLELPLDDPYRRPPAPAGGVETDEPDAETPRRVVVIDLA